MSISGQQDSDFTNQQENYFFRDPIHQFIEVTPQEKEIIDHRYFQRLKRIRQLGMSHYVYHGAEHNRFGHSLGVLHLATKIFAVIVRKNKQKLGWTESQTEKYRQLVRLAALLHDIGHSPFSHVAEEELMPLLEDLPDIGQDKPDDKKKKAKHEHYTGAIILHSDLKNVLNNNFNKAPYYITPDDIWAVIDKGMLPVPEDSTSTWKNPGPLLKNIISGELDADRMDYLLRDSYYTGVKYGVYDVERLIQAINAEFRENKIVMAIDEGGIFAAEALIIARYHMFTQIYFHHIRRIYDYLMNEFLLNECDLPEIQATIETENGTVLINKFPTNIDKYLNLDDSVIETNILKRCSELAEDSISARLINRKHFKLAYSTPYHTQEGEPTVDIISNILTNNNQIEIIHRDCAKTAISKMKLNYDKGDGCIKVLLKNRTANLHQLSQVIERVTQDINVERIYVLPEKQDRAKIIINKLSTPVNTRS